MGKQQLAQLKAFVNRKFARIAGIAKDRRNFLFQPRPSIARVFNLHSLAITNSGNCGQVGFSWLIAIC